ATPRGAAGKPDVLPATARSQRLMVVLVTGGSRGIGKACAAAFVRQGAKVAVLARTKPDVGQLGIGGDVGNEQDVDRAFGQIERQLGPVDVLVNNAAILGPSEHVAKVDPGAWAETYRINVEGTMLCCRRALPSMMERRSGKIINVS